VATLASVNLSGGTDNAADPGESVSMRLALGNASPVALNGATGTLTTTTPGVTVTAATAQFPNVAQGGAGESLAPFAFNIAGDVQCGAVIQFTLEVSSQGSVSRLPFTVDVGNRQPFELFADDVEQGEAKWTHGSLIKKKKKRVDTWRISTKRFRSGGSAWFTPNPPQVTDSYLDTMPVQLPADGRDLQLVFYHTFEFEPGGFDGGVIEISTGGTFEDLKDHILEGGYNGKIIFRTNPLFERDAWISGRLGQFQRVVVDLSSFAGKTVTIRFRIGTDDAFQALGWYVDDARIGGVHLTCTP
ncbi:MAG TPA: hypothetical protein VNO70_00920, partial [Blastocatellia bacterium]|nr:hypothetical protein [Blastocatellia bacterium]